MSLARNESPSLLLESKVFCGVANLRWSSSWDNGQMGRRSEVVAGTIHSVACCKFFKREEDQQWLLKQEKQVPLSAVIRWKEPQSMAPTTPRSDRSNVS